MVLEDKEGYVELPDQSARTKHILYPLWHIDIRVYVSWQEVEDGGEAAFHRW